MTEAEQTTPTFWQRMFQVQKGMTVITKDSKNTHTGANYFDINALMATLRPLLNEAGLLLTQTVRGSTEGQGEDNTYHLRLETKIIDVDSGHIEDFGYVVIPYSKDAQEVGSNESYYRRYVLVGIFCLAAQDDDGNSTRGKGKDRQKNPAPASHTTESKDAQKAKNQKDSGMTRDKLDDIFNTISEIATAVEPKGITEEKFWTQVTHFEIHGKTYVCTSKDDAWKKILGKFEQYGDAKAIFMWEKVAKKEFGAMAKAGEDGA